MYICLYVCIVVATEKADCTVQREDRSDVAGILKEEKRGANKCVGSDLYCGSVCLFLISSGLLFCAA